VYWLSKRRDERRIIQLAAHLKWLQENPNAVWKALNQVIIETAEAHLFRTGPERDAKTLAGAKHISMQCRLS
jgi:hypothetical protein